jgi:mgtE-like transporter
MTHAGNAGFSKALKETFTAYAFDLGGLLAGFIVAYQLGVFRLAPWAIALYPAVLGAKGVIEGLLSGRLSTALHLGTVYPRFSKNTKSFHNLIEATIVLTLVTSVAMSAISLVFGNLVWGITFLDFPAILAVVVATMALGLVLLVVTVKVAFFSFKRGLDPDVMVYPIMSAVASIFITICYVMTLNLFLLNSSIGVWLVGFLCAAHLIIVIYIFPRNLHEAEFMKTIREALASLMIVAVIVNVTGTILRGIDRFVVIRNLANAEFYYTIYPALIGLVSDVGAVVGSTATTKLALGMLKPKLSSIGNHAKNISIAWIASIVMFVVLAFAALLINGIFTPAAFYSYVVTLLVANVIAVTLIVILSFAISILTFQKGLDPGNFVIPIENAFAASVTSIALFLALALLSLSSGI